MEKSSLARRIRAFRKLKGMTQSELADQLGVSIGLLGAIERGNRKVETELISRISSVLGIDPDELTGQSVAKDR